MRPKLQPAAKGNREKELYSRKSTAHKRMKPPAMNNVIRLRSNLIDLWYGNNSSAGRKLPEKHVCHFFHSELDASEFRAADSFSPSWLLFGEPPCLPLPCLHDVSQMCEQITIFSCKIAIILQPLTFIHIINTIVMIIEFGALGLSFHILLLLLCSCPSCIFCVIFCYIRLPTIKTRSQNVRPAPHAFNCVV